jgi:hypothetical protein
VSGERVHSAIATAAATEPRSSHRVGACATNPAVVSEMNTTSPTIATLLIPSLLLIAKQVPVPKRYHNRGRDRRDGEGPRRRGTEEALVVNAVKGKQH